MNYFVSSLSGNDSNVGSIARPWASSAKVNAVAKVPGDIFHYECGGSYAGPLINNTAGVNGSPIIYRSYGTGAKPILHGWKTLTGWVDEGGGKRSITDASLLSTIKMVTLNNAIKAKARYPKTGWLPTTAVSGNTSVTTTDAGFISQPSFAGGEICVIKTSWIIDVGLVSAHTGGSGTVSYSGTSNYNPATGYGFFLQNTASCLTELGDWMYNGTTKKFTMFFGVGVDPNTFTVKVSSVEDVVSTIGKGFTYFEGLEIQGSNRNSVLIQGLSPSCRVDGCTVKKSGFNGIALSQTGGIPDNAIFRFNLIEDTKNMSIVTDISTGITIHRNDIYRNYFDPAGGGNGDLNADAISAGANGYRNGNCTITENRIFDCGYNGINFAGSDVLVERNLVIGHSKTKIDGGGIYTFGGTMGLGNVPYTNRTVRRNIVLNPAYVRPIPTPYGANEENFGIYLDENARNVLIEQNLFAENYINAYFNCSNTITFNDNIFFKSRESEMFINRNSLGNSAVFGLNIQNNSFYNLGATYLLDINYPVADISGLGIINTNRYLKPGVGNMVRKRTNYGGQQLMTLAQWQTNYGYDAASTPSFTASEVSALFYNDQYTSEPIDIGINRKDVNGVAIIGGERLFTAFESYLVLEGTVSPTPVPEDPAPVEPTGDRIFEIINTGRGIYGQGALPLPASRFLEISKGGVSGPGTPGADGTDGREIELQANATHIQWRYVGDATWIDLIALTAITGPAGEDGADSVVPGPPGADSVVPGPPGADSVVPGPPGNDGADGTEIELQVSGTNLQWRYIGAGSWVTLIDLATLGGSLPAGGTINQVLAKNSSTNGDASWKDAAGGGSTLIPFSTVINMDGNYKSTTSQTGAIVITKGTFPTPATNFENKTVQIIEANGVGGKPTFSADFVVQMDTWSNNTGDINQLIYKGSPSGKILVWMDNVELA